MSCVQIVTGQVAEKGSSFVSDMSKISLAMIAPTDIDRTQKTDRTLSLRDIEVLMFATRAIGRSTSKRSVTAFMTSKYV